MEAKMENSKNKGNLLIVEDEPVIAKICHRILAKEGFNILLATDGNMAVKLLYEHKFDLCLIDVRTPGIDGLELYEHISRKFPGLAHKVVFMTGDTLSKNIPEFVEKAGCFLLQKPFTTSELLTAIGKI